jgi:hypothetical protein
MIPRVIHFIWIYVDKHPTEQLLFGLKSAVLNTTCKVVLHTDDKTIKPIDGVDIRYRTFKKDIKGIPFNPDEKIVYKGEAKRIAHISDIERLEILYDEGGIYSDMDVIWLRNPWEFWDKKVVIGFTNKSYKILANSIIMAQPKQTAIKEYHDWLIDIYPAKQYWVPANPYKLWKDNTDVTMVDRHLFFPIKWDKSTDITPQDVEKSIAVHHFASMGEKKGDLFDLLQKDYSRYKKTRKQKKGTKKTRKN